jgi:hypothetical protein
MTGLDRIYRMAARGDFSRKTGNDRKTGKEPL